MMLRLSYTLMHQSMGTPNSDQKRPSHLKSAIGRKGFLNSRCQDVLHTFVDLLFGDEFEELDRRRRELEMLFCIVNFNWLHSEAVHISMLSGSSISSLYPLSISTFLLTVSIDSGYKYTPYLQNCEHNTFYTFMFKDTWCFRYQPSTGLK